ncbi:hypothetical protein HLRTI_002781 [Halorhabdus tiamatea SARL4B]|uniref:Uncharacterized protein n=2 Tax=Halorhabdus TaxID=146825 RepID=F7PIA0_9EURY|nr:hypothetical protein [Halorhabdus tiamatea]ERJ05203.1 hypothetical protein HLRTI_002781 [Halorhabdus tiamatea SARL4B]CCQ34892.1 hypothetical protein HTIA_2790 [Halorhabdus tiamatea SARL4B]
MPRLALSLPAELGPVQGDVSPRSGNVQSLIERGTVDGSRADDESERTPQIESWLACWSDGRQSTENGDDAT